MTHWTVLLDVRNPVSLLSTASILNRFHPEPHHSMPGEHIDIENLDSLLVHKHELGQSPSATVRKVSGSRVENRLRNDVQLKTVL